MKMQYAMTGLTIALAGYAAGASAADPSAVLQQPKGQVFIGQTAAMTLARHDMPLYPGNRVVVAAGGEATVVYIDGCTVTLSEKSLLAVGGPSQCKNGQAVAHTTSGFQNAKIGQAGPMTAKNSVATIEQVEGIGKVGRADAVSGMSLYKGNKVTAYGKDSRVVIRYADGCQVVIKSGKSLMIDSQPVCTPGLVVGGGGVVVGTGGAAGVASATGSVAGSTTAGAGSTGGIVAGGAKAGVVATGSTITGAGGTGGAAGGAAAGAGASTGAIVVAGLAGVSVVAAIFDGNNNNDNTSASPQ